MVLSPDILIRRLIALKLAFYKIRLRSRLWLFLFWSQVSGSGSDFYPELCSTTRIPILLDELILANDWK
jgi:hypothetical protein